MEERGLVEGADATHRWIIDPLDGTQISCMAFHISRFPSLCSAKALWWRVLSIIRLPMNCFLPSAGKALTGREGVCAYRAAINYPMPLSQPALPINHPTGSKHRTGNRKTLPQVAGLRNFGSAALDLAYVAAGRFDGYVEFGLDAWDYAAGIVLVREAGGLVSDETNRQKIKTAI